MTEFEKFFLAFQIMLDRVVIPEEHMAGGDAASWDRRAAYLLFQAMRKS